MSDHRAQHGNLSSAQLWLSAFLLLLLWRLEVEEVTASPEPVSGATFQTLPANSVQLADDVLWECPALSRVVCGVRCREAPVCVAFTFFPPAPESSAGVCRLHQKRHVAVDPGNSQHQVLSGAQTFTLVKGEWIRGPCSSDRHCTQPDSACFSGRCLCSGGLFFDPLLNICLHTCRRGLGDQFLQYDSLDLFGHDLYHVPSDGTAAPCLSTCSGDARCLLLAYVPSLSRCFLKNSTPQHSPSSWRHNSLVITYQRTCA